MKRILLTLVLLLNVVNTSVYAASSAPAVPIEPESKTPQIAERVLVELVKNHQQKDVQLQAQQAELNSKTAEVNKQVAEWVAKDAESKAAVTKAEAKVAKLKRQRRTCIGTVVTLCAAIAVGSYMSGLGANMPSSTPEQIQKTRTTVDGFLEGKLPNGQDVSGLELIEVRGNTLKMKVDVTEVANAARTHNEACLAHRLIRSKLAEDLKRNPTLAEIQTVKNKELLEKINQTPNGMLEVSTICKKNTGFTGPDLLCQAPIDDCTLVPVPTEKGTRKIVREAVRELQAEVPMLDYLIVEPEIQHATYRMLPGTWYEGLKKGANMVSNNMKTAWSTYFSKGSGNSTTTNGAAS